MASIISPKAEVSPKAKIGDNCKIYPFAYIEDDVVIGDNCTIYPFVSIMNGTRRVIIIRCSRQPLSLPSHRISTTLVRRVR